MIIFVLAQVHDDLLGAGVQHVEELAVLRVQTAAGEVVDASQAVDQFPSRRMRMKKNVIKDKNRERPAADSRFHSPRLTVACSFPRAARAPQRTHLFFVFF